MEKIDGNLDDLVQRQKEEYVFFSVCVKMRYETELRVVRDRPF